MTVCLVLDCDDKKREREQKERRRPETTAHAKEGGKDPGNCILTVGYSLYT